MQKKVNKLSTEPYKGVRDFFPVDMAIQKKIFAIWRSVVEKYGYEEYSASVLEPADLYRAKSGDEIVNDQTYTFTDRGKREVTLRPEMTPSLARMMAAKGKDFTTPIRLYSIPNLFRYEQPQRGRLREHWQLNVDIFGISSIFAEIEVINIAYDITKLYGLTDKDFTIKINCRKIIDYIMDVILDLDETESRKLARLIDKKDKISADEFESLTKKILKSEYSKFSDLFSAPDLKSFTSLLPHSTKTKEVMQEIQMTLDELSKLGINNAKFDQTLMRGFDYYTGIVFEIYDNNPKNPRSIFGGGRYDELLSIFGSEKITAVGFGAGDVIARDLMETYGVLDITEIIRPPADLAICVLEKENIPYALDLAKMLRENGVSVVVDLSLKRIGNQIANADKKGIEKVICIGEQEIKYKIVKLKTLATGVETKLTEEKLIAKLRNASYEKSNL